ncbi:GroES-like protein [Thozetella sp. PMI_491]|nr:GroES-like protein [Thozetella sp. PMI_491]
MTKSNTMKAVMWEGKPFDIAVREIPKPNIVHPGDALIRVTSAAICGTDMYIYHGFFGGSNIPYPIGHEAIGILIEIGSDVQQFNVGDRVVVLSSPDSDEIKVHVELDPPFVGYGFGDASGNLGGCQGMRASPSALTGVLILCSKPA